MPRKRLITGTSGGISPGAPFAVNEFLFVSQVAPPVASTQRLARVNDAFQSIIAPGPGGSANSFVLGEQSTEGANGARSVIVGFQNVAGTGAGSEDQILIGSTINLGANIVPGIVVIGGKVALDLASTSTSGVIIGYQAALTTGASHAGTVLIGNGATSQEGNSVGIGAGVTVTTQSIAIGRTAGNTSAAFVAIGDNTKVGNFSVGVGFNQTVVSNSSVAIGHQATTTGDNNVAVGRSAAAQFASCVALGFNTGCFGAGDFAVGGDAGGNYITRLLFGPVNTAGYPGLTWLLNGAAGLGNNVAAPVATIAVGANTGNAAGGGLVFTSGTIGASGSTTQTQVERFRICPGGVTGTPSLRFVNQISTPGAAAGTLLNAPNAGDPAVWMEVLINGTLRYIPAW